MAIDFSPYLNLRIYDKDPGEMYLTALDLMRLNVPQLSVRPGTIEDAMLQSFAFLSTVAVNHINVLPNRLVEGIANLMGTQRTESSYASIQVTITALDYTGGSLESGTVFEHSYNLGSQRIVEYYETSSGVTIESIEPDVNADPPTALPSTTTVLTALDLGQRKSITTGTVLTILNSQTVADSAVALDNFTQGSLGEDDAQFLSRFATQLQSMSNVLTTAKQIETYVLSTYRYVTRAKAYDLTNSEDDRTQAAADEPGYVSLFVYGDDKPLSIFERTTIFSDLAAKSMAGLQLVVQDITILPMTVTATIKIAAGSDYASTLAGIKTSLLECFSPDKFPFIDEAIRKTTIFEKIISVPNVVYVDQGLTFTCSGTTSDGSGNLIFDNKGCLPLIDIGTSTFNMTYL